MSSTSQPTDFSDLYLDLLQRVRQDRNASATAEQAKRYINVGLQDMHVGYGEKFPWAERQAILVTHPLYQDGTVSISMGSTALTGVGTAWDSTNSYGQPNARDGGRFRLTGYERYQAVGNPTTLAATLDTVYLGTEDLSGADYTYYEDEYALASDFARPMDLNRFTTAPDLISLVSRTEFRRYAEGRISYGKPEVATIHDRAPSGDTTPIRRIQFFPIPDLAYQIRYPYVTSNLAVDASGTAIASLSSDDDEPIVPLRYRYLIVLHALYNWYRDKKDDARSAEAKADFEQLLLRITGDNEIGSSKTKIAPRTSPYRSRARRPWRGGTGRFDIDGRFDRLED